MFGVNDRTAEATNSWLEQEGLPFPVLLDPDRSIGQAFGMSRAGDEKYLANPAEGRRPVVVIDKEGIVLKLLPDLSSVEQQIETLGSL